MEKISCKSLIILLSGCTVRFTHANRHCPDHPHAKLLRDDRGALEGLLVCTSRQDNAIAEWLDRYVRSRWVTAKKIQWLLGKGHNVPSSIGGSEILG